MNATHTGLAAWHDVVRSRDPLALRQLLADDVVFWSPIVHRAQVGKTLTTMYLTAALHVIANESFRYVREVVQEPDAILEFETDIDGIAVNGVDLIRFNADSLIIEFKVMLRPMKGIQIVGERMRALLEQLATSEQN